MMSKGALVSLAAASMMVESDWQQSSLGRSVITNGHNQKLHATTAKKVQRKAKKLARRNNRRN